jgi:hypothetical protein
VEEQVLLEVRFRQLVVQLEQLSLGERVDLVSMEILMQQDLQAHQFRQVCSHQQALEEVLAQLAVLPELKKEMVQVQVFPEYQPQLQDVLQIDFLLIFLKVD